MTLGEKQRLFAKHVTRLYLHIELLGHEYNFGRALGRTSNPNSNHPKKLAVDVNLFIYSEAQGKWVYQRATKAHRVHGEWWEQQHELARWGGRWGDGNHYSFEHRGYK